MWISSFSIKSYKSFYETPEIELTRGFNVIVGKNNAGKTALLEALTFSHGGHPHRSRKTVPNSGANFDQNSEISLSFVLTRDEFQQTIVDFNLNSIIIAGEEKNYASRDNYVQAIEAMVVQPEIVLKSRFSSQNINSPLDAFFPAIGEPQTRPFEAAIFAVAKSERSIRRANITGGLTEYSSTFAFRLAQVLKPRIYSFRAERLNISEAPGQEQQVLVPNASNLPQVLNFLQTNNPARFRRYVAHVRQIFPDITDITIPPVGNDGKVRVNVWAIEPDSERADLAIPLAESGTGIGQVLAMLYVVVTSDNPTVIIIDEPQSFLHPGAVRKLFEILNLEMYSQHQYIITTHSPTAITSADINTLLFVHKEGAESSIDRIDVKETDKLRLILSEVGARLSDVFGADNILWVEGSTEEQCFPMILSRLTERHLYGTIMLGVRQTGDFEGRFKKTAFEIYKRLSSGSGLLPPAIGFVFDREGRSETEIDDMIREGKGDIVFTPRRMYENYLLNSAAIASVVSQIEEFQDTPVTPEMVDQWLENHKWNDKYLTAKIPEGERNDELWRANVRGARLLQDLFNELSENLVEYNKIEHGVALTEWIITNAPADLEEIADLLVRMLSRKQD